MSEINSMLESASMDGGHKTIMHVLDVIEKFKNRSDVSPNERLLLCLLACAILR